MIRWDALDWFSGMLPTNTTGTIFTTPFEGSYHGFTNMNGLDPYRKPGYLMPAFAGVVPTNSAALDAITRNAVVSGDDAYMGAGAKIHQMDIATKTVTNGGGTFPHTITPHGAHTGVVFEDIIDYYVGTTKYLFYSWLDSADADIGRYDLSTTFDDDYMTTVPAGAAGFDSSFPHRFIKGADDILYVTDGRGIHAFDGQTGANGTWSKNRLTLPKDYVATSFAKSGDYLFIFAYKNTGVAVGSAYNYRSQCAAFMWDYSSEDPTRNIPIQGNYVNGGFSYQGTVGCFTETPTYYNQYATGFTSQMLLWDGDKNFLDTVTFGDGIPGHGGVEVFGNTVMWNSYGAIYQWGSPYKGLPNALHKTLQAGGSTSEGVLKLVGGQRLIASAGTSPDPMYIYYQDYALPSFTTPIVPLSLPQNATARVTCVKIYWYGTAPEASCHTINYLRLVNKYTTANVITSSSPVGFTRQGSATSQFVDTYYTDATATDFMVADGIGLACAFTAGDYTKIPPIFQAIEVYYEYENI